MNTQLERLPKLISDAAQALAKASTVGEVLESIDLATVAYDAAKLAARLTEAKDAHDEVVAAAHRAMADALIIETRAKCRLADEYDAAQERGEVAKRSDGTAIRDHVPNENKVATVADIGLTRKQVHEARVIRDAERKQPGVIKQTLEQKLRAGEAPLRADVKRVARDTITPEEPKSPSPPVSISTPPDESCHQAKADAMSGPGPGALVELLNRTWARAELYRDMLIEVYVEQLGWEEAAIAGELQKIVTEELGDLRCPCPMCASPHSVSEDDWRRAFPPE
jgi:hypothetical protein